MAQGFPAEIVAKVFAKKSRVESRYLTDQNTHSLYPLTIKLKRFLSVHVCSVPTLPVSSSFC